MKCIIIEDQPPAQRIVQKYIKDYGALTLLGTFSDALAGLEFLRKEEVDLIFLDVHLPKLSGMDLLKTLQQPPLVILTTAFPDFALESYDYNVCDYLLKPFSFTRFVKAISRAESLAKDGEKQGPLDTIYIKTGHEHVKLEIAKILFIRSDGDYTEIHLPDHKILSSATLRKWEDELTLHDFHRVHKSYLINLRKIVKLSTSQVILEQEQKVPIGRSYKEGFEKRILK